MIDLSTNDLKATRMCDLWRKLWKLFDFPHFLQLYRKFQLCELDNWTPAPFLPPRHGSRRCLPKRGIWLKYAIYRWGTKSSGKLDWAFMYPTQQPQILKSSGVYIFGITWFLMKNWGKKWKLDIKRQFLSFFLILFTQKFIEFPLTTL